MKSFPLSILFGTSIALAGCGGGGTAKAGSGGSAMSAGAGGNASTGGISGGGGNGSGKTDAGSTDTVGNSTEGDASAANADGAPRGDLAPVGDSCPAFTPCGGDLVGTWRVKSECLSTMPTSGNCFVGVSAIDLSAFQESFTFRANGTVTVSMTGTMAETVRYAASCFLGDASAALSCSALQQQAQSSWPGQADAGIVPFNLERFECSVDSTGACACDERLGFNQHAQGGTYTTSGNQVTISDLRDGGLPDAGTSEPADYCVSGNTLMLKPMSTTDSTSDILVILTK
jgi:hypothetical protein